MPEARRLNFRTVKKQRNPEFYSREMYASSHKALKRKWILPDIQSGRLFQKEKERNNSVIFHSSGGKYFLCLLVVVFLFSLGNADAQDTLPVNYKARRITLGATSAVLTGGSLIYLNQIWYQQYNTGSFHWLMIMQNGMRWIKPVMHLQPIKPAV